MLGVCRSPKVSRLLFSDLAPCSGGMVLPQPSASVSKCLLSVSGRTPTLSLVIVGISFFSSGARALQTSHKPSPHPHGGSPASVSSLLGITSNRQRHRGPRHPPPRRLCAGQLSDVPPASTDKLSSCLKLTGRLRASYLPLTSTERCRRPSGTSPSLLGRSHSFTNMLLLSPF